MTHSFVVFVCIFLNLLSAGILTPDETTEKNLIHFRFFVQIAMASDTKNERGLIFLHIPKTAGTTLPTVIDRHYLPHATYYFYEYPKDRNDFFALSEERRRELRVLSGHIRFGFHRFLSVPVDYITLLRDPVDLVMSLY